MEYQWNLSWDQATALAAGGFHIRRLNWTDRWLFLEDGIWFLSQDDGETVRVVRATDFTRVEFLALDWTTMWPDQHACVVPEDPEEEPPPEPEPQPEPAGPTVVQIKYTSVQGITRAGRIPNPFDALTKVTAVGTADDYMTISGFRASQGIGQTWQAVNVSFLLEPDEVVRWALHNPTRGFTGIDVVFTFSLA